MVYLIIGSRRLSALDRLEGRDVQPFRQEPVWDRYPAPDEYPSDRHAKVFRNAVVLPFVHTLPVNSFASKLRQRVSKASAPAQRFDDLAMNVHGGNIGKKFQLVKPASGENVSRPFGPVLADNSGMAKSEEKDPYKVECGERLVELRLALGYQTTKAMVDDFPHAYDRVNKWENGGALVPPKFLIELSKRHYQVPYYEFIYEDDMRFLPGFLIERINALRAQPA